jgi:hypothetical protein
MAVNSRNPPDFSFGIELETVIIFHESAIKQYIRNETAWIVKLDENDSLRDDLSPYSYSNIFFNSWAIANDGHGPEWIGDPDATLQENGTDTGISIRPYMFEPLDLV